MMEEKSVHYFIVLFVLMRRGLTTWRRIQREPELAILGKNGAFVWECAESIVVLAFPVHYMILFFNP